MIKSKKALLMHWILFAFIIGFGIGMLINASLRENPTTYIGELQIKMLTAYQKAQSEHLFIEQAAKLSAQQTAHELAANATGCGYFRDYPLWNNATSECYPNYENQFAVILNQKLNNYFVKYKEKTNHDIPLNNYEIIFAEEHIIGTPYKHLNFDITTKDALGNEVLTGLYFIKPSFNIAFDYKISEYSTIIGQAKNLVKKCSEANETELLPCIDDRISAFNAYPTSNLKWQLGSCDGDVKSENSYFRFCVNSSAEPFYYDTKTNTATFKQLQYRFALYLGKTGLTT
ncbi:MAG: hypothetical protein QXH80_04085 [Candidatus Nanoarchaeia archaeon]